MHIFIPIICIAVCFAYVYYMKKRSSDAAKVVEITDFKSEMFNAPAYRDDSLVFEVPYLKKAMAGKPIDAYAFGNSQYTAVDALKDGVKNKLKEVATLGTVRFDTVVTPKYLVLSGNDLYLFGTDTEGELKTPIIYTPAQLQKARLAEFPMQGEIKVQAQARGKNVKAYLLSLPGKDGKVIELIVYSCLIFTNIPVVPATPLKAIQAIVIANDFLKQLGDKYPNMKVELPI